MCANMHTLLEKLSQATKFCLFVFNKTVLQVRYLSSVVKPEETLFWDFLQGVKPLVACGRVTLKAGNTGVKV